MNNKTINKHIQFSFYSISYFLKIVKKSRLPIFLAYYVYISLINFIYYGFVFNILIPFLLKMNIKQSREYILTYLELIFKNILKLFNLNLFSLKKDLLKKKIYNKSISQLLLKVFGGYFFYQKNNISNLFEFWNLKNKFNLKILLKKKYIFFFNNINTILSLINFNYVNKDLLRLLFLSKNKRNKKLIIYFFKNINNNNNFISSIKKYIDIFFLPLSYKIKKKKNFKIFESLFFFNFIRRFRTFFFLYNFYLLLFWFNKLLLKINVNKNLFLLQKLNKIKFFNDFKIQIGLNIKYVWLQYKILIPNFNLNYLLYNNIIKQQW